MAASKTGARSRTRSTPGRSRPARAEAEQSGQDAEKKDPGPSAAGIFVYVRDVPGGKVVHYDLVGGYDPLAAPSTLRLAVQAANQHLGLS